MFSFAISRFRAWRLLLAALVVWGTTAPSAEAQQSAAKRVDEAVEPVTPEREAAALTFARLHHKELAELLSQLKAMDTARYEAAIQELFKTSEQLAKLQVRAPDRYATELELWKIDSRVRLLVARSTMVDPDELRDEIKQLLVRRNALRIQQMENERARLLGRAKRLEASIEDLRENGDASAERELQRLLKSVQPARKTKPAADAAGSAASPAAVNAKPRSGNAAND